RQHASNPVDWYPWGDEALQRARQLDRPIFLSIGYSACHWCHVMEHESFEDEEVARLLNEHFVPIKVDREERPDLDQIYMNAVQLMTGRGGWPMSVFLTPDLKPFFGGTYWPPTARMGMPGFEQVLIAVNDAWQNRREAAEKQAEEMTAYLQEDRGQRTEDRESGVRSQELSAERMRGLLEGAVRQLARAFDARNGGFGTAPKFPHSMDLQLLLRQWKRRPSDETLRMVTLTLDKMAAGGIYDHLAGGFARYSVDERWLVPHFEKMLYDNALLTSAYLDAFQATKELRFAKIARETCDYILQYMTDPAGGFHSTEDADSEGEEGKFYVWTPPEIKQVLGPDAGERFCYVYDVSEAGNFEHGTSTLNLPKTIEQVAAIKGWNGDELRAELAKSRAKLLAVRDRRVRPSKDDKVLVSWNALMIDAMARTARAIDGNAPALHSSAQALLASAMKAAEFVLKSMSRPDGRLFHTWRHGKAKLDAYLDDYAYLVNALVTLYEATFDERWIDEAARLADLMLMHFEDKAAGGFFFTADDHEQLIARNKDFHDASVPSGNGMAATALIRLGRLTGRTDFLESARRAIVAGLPTIERSAMAAGQLLIALDMWLGPMHELVLIGGANEAENQAVLNNLRRAFLPNSVIAYRPGQAQGANAPRSPLLDPLFAGRAAMDGQPTLYVCQNFTCRAPVSGVEAIQATLRDLAG
ncbi:MAG TPA: thioredoxin domain-containing protein, partial [Pirellulaceae bacterium]|nr:thioredoxin domain-containing protein [Pirellulaceae bacterium]